MNGFFKWDDEHIEELEGQTLDPGFWWSRRYEYPFALKFAKKGLKVLDAACGTYHPLKRALAGICETHCCDVEHVEAENFTRCSIDNTPYKDKEFDVVFCISVIEHLDEQTIKRALAEFKRILKPKGKIVLTIDYPTMPPERMMRYIEWAGLDAKPWDYNLPEDAISSSYFGMTLNCYHIEVTHAKQTKSAV
jgi:SAM-dependent methyltransferase